MLRQRQTSLQGPAIGTSTLAATASSVPRRRAVMADHPTYLALQPHQNRLSPQVLPRLDILGALPLEIHLVLRAHRQPQRRFQFTQID